MSDVEILSSQLIYQTDHLWWFIPVGAGLGFLMTFIPIVITGWVDLGAIWRNVIFILVCTIIGFFFGLLSAIMIETETNTIDYIEYKVIVDDSVPMNEFLDKYEILDQEGKIYTIKERE